MNHPDTTLDITSIEKDLWKTCFSISAECLSWLTMKYHSAGHGMHGIRVLVCRHSDYCLTAVEGDCQVLQDVSGCKAGDVDVYMV